MVGEREGVEGGLRRGEAKLLREEEVSSKILEE